MNFKDRLEIIYYTANCAIISYQGYGQTFSNPQIFKAAYPEATSNNIEICHRIDGNKIIFVTTSDELLSKNNRSLFIAWQIALGIAGMTSVFEYYLKVTAEKITGKECKGIGIFYQFENMTKILISQFQHYEELHKYYQVRHITMHNIGRVDKKFKEKTQQDILEEEAYPFYVQDLKKYKALLIKTYEEIEMRIPRNYTTYQ